MSEPDQIDAPVPAPAGCASCLDHEVWFTELSEEIRSIAEDDSKLLAESIKARRAAAALALEREKVVALARLDRSRRALTASKGAQRAPLKLVSGGQDR